MRYGRRLSGLMGVALLALGCDAAPQLPSIGEQVAGPIDVELSLDGTAVYLLNSNRERIFASGSLLAIELSTWLGGAAVSGVIALPNFAGEIALADLGGGIGPLGVISIRESTASPISSRDQVVFLDLTNSLAPEFKDIDSAASGTQQALTVGLDPFGVAIAPLTNRAFVVNQLVDLGLVDDSSDDTEQLSVADLTNGAFAISERQSFVRTIFPTVGTTGLTRVRIDPTESYLLLFGRTRDFIVVDAASLTLEAKIPFSFVGGGLAAGGDIRDLRFLPLNNVGRQQALATVRSVNEPSLVTLDLTDLPATLGNDRVDLVQDTIVAVVPLAAGPAEVEFFQTGDGQRLAYVACFDEDLIQVIDLDIETVIDEIPTGDGPLALAISTLDKHLFVANYLGNSVQAIDLEPTNGTFHQVVAQFPEETP